MSLWSLIRKLRLTKPVSKSFKTKKKKKSLKTTITIIAKTETSPLLTTWPLVQCPGLGSQSLNIYRSTGSEGGRKAIQV